MEIMPNTGRLDKHMKTTLTILAVLIVLTACQNHKVHITKKETDERGLISVQFTQDGKEYALDYLTAKEYEELIK